MGMYDTATTDNTGALISSASTIASNAINAFAQSSLNQRTKDFDIQMYAQQRKDALADWNKQNEYNSPAAQMARFKAAGLNPNLIYGRGDAGNATAVRSSSAPAWNPVAPRLSSDGGIGQYYSIRAQQAQLDNLVAQNQLILAQKSNVDSQTQVNLANVPKIGSETELNKFSLQFQQDTRDVNIALKQGNLNQVNAEIDKINADTSFRLDENQRQALSNVVSIREGVARILKMDQERSNLVTDQVKTEKMIQLLGQDSTLKQLDIDFINATGNTGRPHDSLLPKMVEMVIGQLKSNSGTQHTPTNIQPLNDPNESQLDDYFNKQHMQDMKNADWKRFTR